MSLALSTSMATLSAHGSHSGSSAHVRVVCRTRPSASFSHELIQLHSDSRTIALLPSSSKGGTSGSSGTSTGYTSTGGGSGLAHEFRFHSVLHNASQDEVFDASCRDAVENVVDGFNATVLAYGQTGAGKTYTVMGGRDYASRGLVPRAIHHLFSCLSAQVGADVTVRVSFCEIYNELIYDLLAPETDPADLTVCDETVTLSPATAASPENNQRAIKGVYVRGLSKPVVAGEEDALALLFEGITNRSIAEHQLNKSSSRSHAIFTVHVECRLLASSKNNDDRRTVSKLHLVDLAGSERLSKTQSEGRTQREAQYINRSLSLLEQVVVALGEKNRSHVPYRSSRLTHMLEDSLGGNCLTTVIANVWGEAQHIDETLSTFRFAKRMGRVHNQAVRNIRMDPETEIRRLEREVRELQRELAMHDQLVGRTTQTYVRYAREQRLTLRSQVQAFLDRPPRGRGAAALEATGDVDDDADDDLDPIEMLSLRHVRECLVQCRALYRAQGRELEEARAALSAAGTSAGIASIASSPTKAAGAASMDGEKAADSANAVGDSDVPDAYAAALGGAPDDARPQGGMDELRPRVSRSSADGDVTSSMPASSPPAPLPAPKRGVAFEEYKLGPGKELADASRDNKAALHRLKTRARDLGLEINQLKKSIDDASASAPQISSVEGETVELSEDEYQRLLVVKDLKRQYRTAYESLREVRSEIDYTQRLAEKATEDLVSEFDAWYTAAYGVVERVGFYDDRGENDGNATNGEAASPANAKGAPPAPTLDSGASAYAAAKAAAKKKVFGTGASSPSAAKKGATAGARLAPSTTGRSAANARTTAMKGSAPWGASATSRTRTRPTR